MNTKKVIILLVCTVFLGLQCMVVFVPYSVIWGSSNWKLGDKPFWPFMRYPMYADGKAPGDKFMFQELRIRYDDGERESISHTDLGLMNYRYEDLIWSTRFVSDSSFTPDQSDYNDFKHLSYLIKKHISLEAERIELWRKEYKLTSSGIEDLNVDWEYELSVPIMDDSTSE